MREEDIWREAHEIDQEPEQEERPWLKKVFITVIGGLLALLTISFIFVSHPVGSVLQGIIESDPVENNIIDFGDFSILFEGDTLSRLQGIYFDEREVEFSVCLIGEKEGQIYRIHDLYQPKMFSQSFTHVSFEPCSSESLVILHSHPYKSCIASSTDINSLRKSKERNADALMVVMCEPGRFSVYG